MEYENLKHLQEKKEELVADHDIDTCTIDTSSGSQQQIQADSFSSSYSASYQVFYPGDNVETPLMESSLHEESSTPDRTAAYSHPAQPMMLRPDKEEDEEGHTKTDVSSDKDQVSQSVYQVPSIPAQPIPGPVELPPNSTAELIDNTTRESDAIQVSDVTAPSHQARRVSDTVVNVQHVVGRPVAKKSLSVSSGSRGGNRFQTEPTSSVVPKPLIMKVLPLYLCMDDGKVYADQNAASIPTHHLIEVKGLEKNIVLQEINQLPSIPPPIISKETDPLTHPNPVYETVPRDLATHSTKAAVVTDQPRIQSSQSLPSETPPPLPPPTLIQEPSRVSGITPAITASLTPVTKDVSNANNDRENVTTQSNVTAPTAMGSNLKAIPSVPKALSTDVLQPVVERPTYISTSEYYGDGYTGFSSHRLDEVHSYYYFTIVAAIVVGLCLDFVVLLAVFLPALWFANKASNSKHGDNIQEVKRFGRRALVLNIIGCVLHVLFVIVVATAFITGVSVSLNS